jgi:hypothetical protein
VGFGFAPAPAAASAREREINQLALDLPAYWEYGTFDAPIVYAALEALKEKKPRVLYIMLGEGDEWAHEGRYDLYLDATVRADRFLERIWTTLQSMPEYRGTTSLIVTTDHGRGLTTKDWRNHGREVPAAENTIALAVGEDFHAAMPKSAAPLPLR